MDNTVTDIIKTVTDIIEEVRSEMCIDYCKRHDECCEVLDNGGDYYCPLYKL